MPPPAVRYADSAQPTTLAMAALPQPCVRPPTSFHAVSAVLNGVSAQGVCNTGGVLDYFPTNTNNTPEAWSYANQTAAGNAANSSLLPVALYGIPWPKLNFLPRHWTLRSQAAPPAGCGLVQSTRKLQGIATQRVTQPAQFTYTWQLDARAPVAGGQTYSAGEGTTPAPAVTLDLYALNFTSPITNVSLSVRAWVMV